MRVLTNNTFFTGESNGETYQAMVWRVVCVTYPTGHSGVGPQTFMPHEFVEELCSMHHPVFEVGLPTST